MPPRCFLSHDSKERDSSDLCGSIANAQAVVMGPKVGRCKWNAESNNNPSCLASSEVAPVRGTPGPALSSTSRWDAMPARGSLPASLWAALLRGWELSYRSGLLPFMWLRAPKLCS